MASHSGTGKSYNGRDSNPKYLGVKKFGGQFVKAGNIIIRQFGNKFYPALKLGVMQGKDFTLFAIRDGIVRFRRGYLGRTFVSVEVISCNSDLKTDSCLKS